MSTRDKFLKDFNSISNNFAQNISVYYALDFRDSLGMSYFELNKVSSELGRYFSNIFSPKSQYVGVCLSDYFLLPCIILGIWKSGCCFAGVGTQYTKKDSLHFLNFLGVKYLISDKIENECEGEVISSFSIHKWKFFVSSRQTNERELGDLGDICYGIMTSGSTGEPKIIEVPWSCILPNARELSDQFEVTEDDCILQASPYSFDPFFIELFMAFLNGCSIAIVSNSRKLSPSDLLRILFDTSEKNNSQPLNLNCMQIKSEHHFPIIIQKLAKKCLSILQMTPGVFRRWTNDDIKNFILSPKSHLRILVLGGEKFPTEILKLKCPDNATRIFNIYGITEISCWAFLKEVTNCSTNAEISLGKPLSDIIYKILENGELEIGSNVRICYVNGEKISEVDKPIFRKTGDIVRVYTEEIFYVGRTIQVIKKYGIKVNLGKIEDFFVKINKSIKECFCVFDEERLKLGLFYVPVNAKTDALNYRLITFEEFNGAGYEIPTDIKDIEKPDYLIQVMEPPLNLHGKCDKQQLFQYLKGIKKTDKPKSDLETIFENLWIEVLGIKKIESSARSFLELGGNSVLALQLVTRLEEECFDIPQNFISELLGRGCYDDCLRLLLGRSGGCRKKIKIDTEVGDVGLLLRWKFDLGKCVDATPAVFSYQGKKRIVVGSHSFKLSCLSPDGEEIWTTFLKDRIESGFKPTKDGSKGFIGCYDHHIYCLSTSDGNVIWKFKTGDMVKSTPCLTSDEKIVFVASYDKNLYCLSADEGQLKKLHQPSNGGIFCSGIISDSLNTFYLGTLDGTCLCISQETLELTWKTKLGSPVFASPCLIPIKPEILFTEVLGIVHCLHALSGEKIWTFKAGGNIYSSPIVEDLDGVIHILFGCHDANLHCLRYEEGAELKWKQQLDSPVFARPSIASDFSSVCVATTKGFIWLCDFVSGSIKNKLKLNGEVFSSPVYCSPRLFVGCRDNKLQAEGQLLWEPRCKVFVYKRLKHPRLQYYSANVSVVAERKSSSNTFDLYIKVSKVP